jgi:ribosomal protein L11 methyltransferase
MSAEWQTQGATSWKLSLPCTRAEGEAVESSGDLPGFDPPPVVMATEPDPVRPDAWRLDVYVEEAPSPALLAAVRALAPSADAAPTVERIDDQDWVTISQRWLEPIRAGRFFVHTAAHADAVPPEAVPFLIEAGRAFGTGHHETTAGCLEMLDGLARDGAVFAHVADVGTGTGLLAFAAAALWPDARVIASDIDPVAIEVAAVNAAANGLPADRIALAVADGLDDPALAAAAPFDLLVANILAGPLIALAPSLAGACRPGGTVLLAGLLAAQAADVLSAYARSGMRPARRLDRGDWSILALERAPLAVALQ